MTVAMTESALQEVAFNVRGRLEVKFGALRVAVLFSSPMAEEFVKATYVAVREQIEKEDA